MENKEKKNLVSSLVVVGLILMAMLIFPWKLVNWGEIRMVEEETVTVSGYAESLVSNNIVSFTASVEAYGDDKDEVTGEANEGMSELIEEVKAFGIEDDDIQTETISVYQREEYLRDDEGWSGEMREGQWVGRNSISIVLRDVDRADELASLLTRAGAVDVYGPSLRVDNEGSEVAKQELMVEAVENAREKAEIMAEAAGKRLGGVVEMVEGEVGTSLIRSDVSMALPEAGGGVPVEIGSSQISQSVTVVFELK